MKLELYGDINEHFKKMPMLNIIFFVCSSVCHKNFLWMDRLDGRNSDLDFLTEMDFFILSSLTASNSKTTLKIC